MTSMLSASAAAIFAVAPPSVPPVIDGAFDEWGTPHAAVVDAIGDATGGFDVVALDAIATGGRFALRLELAEPLNLQSGHGDDGTLVIRAWSEGREVLLIDLRSRQVRVNREQSTWDAIDYVSAPTVASTVFEMSMDARALGLSPGDEVIVDVSSSDELDEALKVKMTKGAAIQRVRSDPAKGEGALRVCSLNTYHNGALDEQRAPRLGRLVDAMEADLICLQEEWDSDTSKLVEWVQSVDPLEDGARWGATRIGGNVVLHPEQTEVFTHPDSASGFTLTLVDTGDRAYILASVHLKCCGYAGSEEDDRRVFQAQTMRRAIGRIRGAQPGDRWERFKDAPFLLVGDWNLVGSGRCLEVFTDGGHLDLRPMRLSAGRNTTWRDLTPDPGGFPPGRLDAAVASADLPVLRTFALDTADLDDEMLGALGLEGDDAQATDHLMLVIDLDRRADG